MARWESDEKNAKFRRECKYKAAKDAIQMQKYSWSFRREAIHSGESRQVAVMPGKG
ncbi:hypothetical protein EJF18_10001 [Clavispora lusitaniae]|uniref:Uncharacterized protein n=1 Tax=Clavispora lusitaniae TaxID=36911 RepID=A0ACD0WC94_CLALS|nr:hypothetical protein EJF14_10001 [Clavispora lusitaniae]QFZ31773.1 hypothetical protein EJF16_10001 [Clavispora lusitaniae]QFZ37442.1 hypothetical protein EJF15_10001 [Clavispora lusitaniae]QFZ43126.1 hypothetical protein EJF18_10001 [Clavispora lusitaniae]QFZ48802.1 hypothetical protein EJF17_10001 [Clavispora lusitaniae]